MENYFLPHRCTLHGIQFTINAKEVFRTLHRTVAHPSVEALETLMGHSDTPNIDSQKTKTLKKIGKDYRVCKEVSSGVQRSKFTV